MKKVLSLLCIMAAMVGSATAAGYVLPSNQPGALTPADIQPTHGMEVLYAWGQKNVPDAWGVRGCFNLYSSGEGRFIHQFNIKAGVEFGDDDYSIMNEKIDQELWMVPVTAGYDLNIGLCDNVFLDLGVKVGVATGSYEEKWNGLSASESFCACTAGAGVGIKVQCSDHLYLKAGYEFNRTFTDSDLGADMNQHLITAGLEIQF